MKTISKLTLLLSGLAILSCNQSQKKQNKKVTQDTIAKRITNKNTPPETISEFLDKALTIDTIEFNNEFEFDTYKSFLFFKSGHIISKTEKNALIVFCPTDTMYTIKLYSVKDGKWQLSDSISGLDAFPTRFDAIFDDYNFDEQTDIYIQVTASDGWSLSRGHLLIINPKTKKFELHPETRALANMKPDKKARTVLSEEWIGYDMQNQIQLTILTNKWVKGQLKTTSKKNIKIKP